MKAKVKIMAYPTVETRRRGLGLYGAAGIAAAAARLRMDARAARRIAMSRRPSRTATICRRWKAGSTPRIPPSRTTTSSATRRHPRQRDTRAAARRRDAPTTAIVMSRRATLARTALCARLSLRHAGAADARRIQSAHRGRAQRTVAELDGHIWVPIDDEHTYRLQLGYARRDQSDAAHPANAEANARPAAGRGQDDLIPGTFKLKRNLSQRLPDRPPDAEDADLHRHRRRQHPGFRAAGRHGADRRPLQGVSRHHPTRRSCRCGG